MSYFIQNQVFFINSYNNRRFCDTIYDNKRAFYMTDYNYSCPQDRFLVSNAIDKLVHFVFGINNKETIGYVKKAMDNKIKSVFVYPQGTENKYVGKQNPGVVYNEQSKLTVHFMGYKGAKLEQYEEISGTALHEFCHALTHILPQEIGNVETELITDDALYTDFGGKVIKTTDNTAKIMGVALNEAMMDIITTMAIKQDCTLNPIELVKFVNEIQYNVKNTIYPVGYGLVVPLACVAIAACSNVGQIDYNKFIDNGIFGLQYVKSDGTPCFANDFLYGIVFNPVHIKKEYDKFMGAGAYEQQCDLVDGIVCDLQAAKTLNLSQTESNIKIHMDNWRLFFKKKMEYYRNKNVLNDTDYVRLATDFEDVFLDATNCYNDYFTYQKMMYNQINNGMVY